MQIEKYKKKAKELWEKRPERIKVPVEMLPVWTAMAIPHWMIALQAGLTVVANEAMRAVPSESIGIVGVGFLGLAILGSTLWEAAVLKNKGYVVSPITTGLYWATNNRFVAAGLNNVGSTLAGVLNPADWGSLLIGGDRGFYANLVARGLVLGVLGGCNLAINNGYTERLGTAAGKLVEKIKK